MIPINLIGLLLGLVGSGLIVLPTFRTVRRVIIEDGKIDKLEKGRRDLLQSEEIGRDDDHFQEVISVINSERENSISEENPSIRSVPFGVYGGGGFVSVTDSEGDVQRTDDGIIGSILIVDTWIHDEIDRLKSVPVQRVRGTGFALTVVSVFIQGMPIY